MHMTLRKCAFAGALIAALCSFSAQAELKNRYSFATDATDSVSGANGTLQGSASVADGQLVLDGEDGSAVQLPSNILSNFNAVTIEAWATYPDNPGWARLFDFGDSNDGGLGRNYLFVSPHSGPGDTRFVISDADPGFNHEEAVNAPGTLDNLGPTHLAAVLDNATHFMGLYINGQLVSSRSDLTISLSSVSGALNYIGKSLYPDPYLVGSIDEFRIYNSALPGAQILADYTAGPEVVGATPGTLQSIRLSFETNMVLNGLQQAVVYGQYSNLTNEVDISASTNLIFQSSNSTIVSATNGLLMAKRVGTVTITVSNETLVATRTVTVVLAPTVLKYRFSFNEAAGSTTVTDSVSHIEGEVLGGAVLSGDGRIDLDGADGYVNLPNGIISKMTNATFELWTTWSSANGQRFWERIFDFGNSTQGEDLSGTGQTYAFLTPRGGASRLRFAMTIGTGERLTEGNAIMTQDVQQHIVLVYNSSAQQASIYVNGKKVGSGSANVPLSRLTDINNWIGRSQYNDPYYTGSINEFRIYEGALTAEEVAFSGALGPDVVGGNAGTLQSIEVRAASTNLVLGGLPEGVTVFANYQNLSNVNVSSFPGIAVVSDNTNVVSLSTNLFADGVTVGHASVSATFNGKQASLAFNVSAVAGALPPKLVHRYSFNETAGATTVKDSVGTADGTLIGTGTFSGTGTLTLPGTDGYIDLPNGIVSSLSNATFETWTTWTGNRLWERIFDFGSSDAGEGASGTGQTYLFVSPRGGPGFTRFAVTINSGAGESPVLEAASALPVNQESHVVITYNYDAGAVALYINGVRIAIGAATIPLDALQDINNWIGRSQWNDPFYTGIFNEFRIYDGAMLASDVAASFAAGPNATGGPAPKLTAAAGANGTLVITWLDSATDYKLDSSSTLGGGWSEVTAPREVGGGVVKVTLPTSGAASFFRLRKTP
jgi:hypothetical protein